MLPLQKYFIVCNQLSRLLEFLTDDWARHCDDVSQCRGVVLDVHTGTLADLHSIECPRDGRCRNTADLTSISSLGVWSYYLLLQVVRDGDGICVHARK